MKNNFYILAMIMVFVNFAKAQSTNCQLLAVPSYSATVTCSSTITVSGSVSLKYYSTDPPGYHDLCPGAQISVQLQYQSGSYWYNMGSAVTVNNGNTWNRTATLISAYYRVVATVVTDGYFCNCSPSYTSGSTYLTFQTAPSATFKVDGQTVNPSTYTQVYGCSTSTAQMTDITWSGTNSSYYWKVDVVRASDGLPKSTGWSTGTPPGSPFDLRAFILAQYTTLPGQYTVTLWVKNVCNTSGVAYTGKIQINTVPVACVQLANNSSTGCNPAYYINLGTYSSPASTCANSPKITASCSDGQWVGGYWNLIVWEFDMSNNFIKTVVSTGNQTLTNTSDISCLNLNDWSSPLGYFYTNSTGYKYVVYFVVGNSCGSSVDGGYFVDNTGGCKTDGGEDVTGIGEPSGGASFTAYPNPAASELNVAWQYHPDIAPTVKLYSIEGQQVNVPAQPTGLGQLKLDVSGLEKGLYLIELNDGIRQVKKVTIK